MNYIILGIDISSDDETKLMQRSEYYGCTFENLNSIEKLDKRIKTCEAHCVIIIQLGDGYINTNEEKYIFTTRVKMKKKVKILYISKNIDMDERLRWLSYGATGYIIYPYHVDEILRRAMMLLSEQDKTIVTDKNFLVDLRMQEVLYHGEKLPMTPSLFKLTLYLIENPDRLVTRHELMREVYNYEEYLSDRSIDTLIKLMRKMTNFDLIKTVRGKGYIYSPNIVIPKTKTSNEEDIGSRVVYFR